MEGEYHFFGTPIEEERESHAGQHRKDVRNPASTKALPLHKQVSCGGLVASRGGADAWAIRAACPPTRPPADCLPAHVSTGSNR